MRIKTVLATLVAATTLTVLTACSGSDDASASFNDADVTFAQDMIPHHRQATEMAGLAAERTENADVLTLAEQITAAQGPEIDMMSGWLKSWDKKVPSDGDGMEGMDHGSSSSSDMPGMMSDDEMAALEDASGSEFDRQFLTMMTAHHEGAIEMAKTEEADGKYAKAVALAKEIQKDQAAEISTMESLLQS
ncbi:DUF305 domain-containing protein [Aeromicrobium sp.]|uniref:DUF305 domain-containing protein n=1 Tax=Aeromicrobium sp. TaxID=1871063 RepID=UPI0030BF5BF2